MAAETRAPRKALRNARINVISFFIVRNYVFPSFHQPVFITDLQPDCPPAKVVQSLVIYGVAHSRTETGAQA